MNVSLDARQVRDNKAQDSIFESFSKILGPVRNQTQATNALDTSVHFIRRIDSDVEISKKAKEYISRHGLEKTIASFFNLYKEERFIVETKNILEKTIKHFDASTIEGAESMKASIQERSRSAEGEAKTMYDKIVSQLEMIINEAKHLKKDNELKKETQFLNCSDLYDVNLTNFTEAIGKLSAQHHDPLFLCDNAFNFIENSRVPDATRMTKFHSSALDRLRGLKSIFHLQKAQVAALERDPSHISSSQILRNIQTSIDQWDGRWGGTAEEEQGLSLGYDIEEQKKNYCFVKANAEHVAGNFTAALKVLNGSAKLEEEVYKCTSLDPKSPGSLLRKEMEILHAQLLLPTYFSPVLNIGTRRIELFEEKMKVIYGMIENKDLPLPEGDEDANRLRNRVRRRLKKSSSDLREKTKHPTPEELEKVKNLLRALATEIKWFEFVWPSDAILMKSTIIDFSVAEARSNIFLRFDAGGHKTFNALDFDRSPVSKSIYNDLTQLTGEGDFNICSLPKAKIWIYQEMMKITCHEPAGLSRCYEIHRRMVRSSLIELTEKHEFHILIGRFKEGNLARDINEFKEYVLELYENP